MKEVKAQSHEMLTLCKKNENRLFKFCFPEHTDFRRLHKVLRGICAREAALNFLDAQLLPVVLVKKHDISNALSACRRTVAIAAYLCYFVLEAETHNVIAFWPER